MHSRAASPPPAVAPKRGEHRRLVMSAIIMPMPAISPSSETPRYAVGRNERKPGSRRQRRENQPSAIAGCRLQKRAHEIVVLVVLAR